MKHTITSLLFLLPTMAGAQLTDTLTIGGANPDYTTISAAVTALMSQGATGNLTFNIRPGTYTGRYSLGEVPGNYARITFRSESNVADSVVLEADASLPANNYIFRLIGTDSITFDHLYFRPLDSLLARAILFSSACNALTITDCVFEGSAVDDNYPDSFERIMLQFEEAGLGPPNPQDLAVTNNVFRKGYAAMNLDFYGFGAAPSSGLNVSGNLFDDQRTFGLIVRRAVGQISDNTFRTNRGYYYTGISTLGLDGSSQIVRNRMVLISTLGDCTGIEFTNTPFTAGNMIANNMIYCVAESQAVGIAVEDIWGLSIVHNSVLIGPGPGTYSAPFHHRGVDPDGQDAVVRNNLFANHDGGAAYAVVLVGNVAVEDHNCLYTNGQTFSAVNGNLLPDLAAHQAVTGLGASDTDMDPVFPLQPDLHMNACGGSFTCPFYTGVGADLDGDARGNPVCDMGADEHGFTDTIQAPLITLDTADLPYTLGLGAAYSQYDWSTGASTPTILITAGGFYACNVVDANGCSFTVNVPVVVPQATGIRTYPVHDVVVFPVPVGTALTIKGLAHGVRFHVLDALGRTVLRGVGSSTTTVDTTELPSGTYLLQWRELGGAPHVVRFIKD